MTPASQPVTSTTSDGGFYVFNAVISTSAVAFLGYLLLVRHGAGGSAHVDLRFLPAVNATFNAMAACFLVAGYVAIRRQNAKVHKYCMVSAFTASVMFLICYVAYHYVHGDTKFGGHGLVKLVYLLVLVTHVVLSMAVVPLALTSFYFAATRRFARHKRVTRYALPIWLYVSVTGVVIFFMLRGSLPVAP